MTFNNLDILVVRRDNRPFSKISNIQLDSEAVRARTIETRWNECEKYLHIIHFPLSLSSKPLFQAERRAVRRVTAPKSGLAHLSN